MQSNGRNYFQPCPACQWLQPFSGHPYSSLHLRHRPFSIQYLVTACTTLHHHRRWGASWKFYHALPNSWSSLTSNGIMWHLRHVLYECSRLAITHHLQSAEHCIHLTLNGWTSPNMFSFLGLTAQFFEKGAICSFVLDFVKYGCISHLIFHLWLKFHEQDVRAPHRWTSRSGTWSSVEIFWYQ